MANLDMQDSNGIDHYESDIRLCKFFHILAKIDEVDVCAPGKRLIDDLDK